MEHKERIATAAQRIKEAMDTAGKNQASLAQETGISKGTISKYLSGKVEPRSNAAHKLAVALNVSEMWLWGYDVPKVRTAEQKKNDVLVDAVTKMRKDPEFFELVTLLADLPATDYASIKHIVATLSGRK